MSFRDVAGQDEAVRFFRVAERTGRLAHAYILVGPEGSGRRALARALGAWLFCESRTDDNDACGTCRSCRRIAADEFPDLHWYARIEGKQQLTVDVVEELRHDIHLKPIERDRKVFVLEDADKLNPSSANKLLKVLEEPPPESLLLLLALDVRDFLPTLLSRCHVIRLRPLAVDELAARLERESGCSPDEARYLGHFTMGSPGLSATLAAGEFFRERGWLIDLIT
ncbi:MAG TPA: DNA polymerase III subunit delta', partial [Planctomycetota bacterium]|nr:DNA polymerase III subunit delta' [Planctomycetota bacterium]